MYLLQQEDVLRKEKNIILFGEYPRVSISFDNLSSAELKNNLIPIGSVEFVTKYCSLHNISLPKNKSYPIELASFLKRKIRQGTFGSALETEFVKPIKTKLFTGAVKKELTESVESDEPVWISDAVEFIAEFRCYVINGQLVGYSRYDDGDEDINFDVNIVNSMIERYTTQPIGYTIDVGIVNDETVLVEVNDGWSLGYYPWGTMTEQKYIELITKRWNQIFGDK
jgi:hypothetical protein